ncbi:hypothetical protein TNCV_3298021 [Trichonephila clavipes]|uniref:Uncharacterized protein n=1 Tax=Trichonephila clavipes TaxID=2585209 RepID=A0A8X7B8E3_TRICX|nr:hypothetical protein TNCV_3298021 [Trichonephila clavipes]
MEKCYCIKRELDLFTTSPIPLAIDRSSIVEIHPVASISDNNTIEFLISDEKRDPGFERMSPKERVRAGVFLPITDNLVAKLNKRRDCYEVLNTRFEIFRNLHEKDQEVTKQAKYLA